MRDTDIDWDQAPDVPTAILTQGEQETVGRARDLLAFADGFGAAGGGNAELARLTRVAARDVLELVEALTGERRARIAAQADRDRCLEIIGRAAYDQVVSAVADRIGT